jgi:hypothetical protein
VFRTPSWNFSALLASPGFAVLLPTERHADVAEEVILELPHLAGNLLHDAHTAILRANTTSAEFALANSCLPHNKTAWRGGQRPARYRKCDRVDRHESNQGP